MPGSTAKGDSTRHMASSYPPDRFDVIPDDLERVGAHRAPPKPGAGWVKLAWAAIAVIVLVGLGVATLFIASGRIDLSAWFGTQSEPVVSASQGPVEATIDPSLSVTVLNGTQTDGLAEQVGATLAESGWMVGTQNNANDRGIEETVVYYAAEADLGAAKALAEQVGGAPTVLSPGIADTGAQLMVVLGADFK